MNTKHFSDMMEAIDLCASNDSSEPNLCGIHFLVCHTKNESIVQLCATDRIIFIRTQMNLESFTRLFKQTYPFEFNSNTHVEGMLYLNPQKQVQLKKSYIEVNEKYPNIKKRIPDNILPISGCEFPVLLDLKYLSKIQKIKQVFCIDDLEFTETPIPDYALKKYKICIFHISEKTFIGLKTLRNPPVPKKIPNFKDLVL